MRVVNILTQRGRAGTEMAFVQCTRLLLELGHAVIAIVPTDALVVEHLARLDIALYQLNGIHDGAPADERIDRHPGLVSQPLVELLRSRRPDIVLIHTLGKHLAGVLHRATTSLCPMVLVHHGSPVCPHIGDYTVFAANREFLAQLFADGHPRSLSALVPHSVDVSLKPTPADTRDRLVIGYMGRFSPDKKVDMLVDALARLRDLGAPGFSAVLAGDGPQLEALTARAQTLAIAHLVRFPGWLKGDAKRAFFADIDLFCLPSMRESFGLVLVEAMAAGVPVVATSTAGSREILRGGVDGVLVASHTADAVAAAMCELLHDEDSRRALGRRGRERVERSFSERAVAAALEAGLTAAVAGFRERVAES